VDHLPALDDVQPLGVWRAVIVDKGLVVEADGIDHQLVALVTADRLAIPGEFWVLRVRDVKIDVPYLLITLKNDRDLLGRLHEVDRREAAVAHEGGNARRPAARARRVADLTGQH